MRTAIYLFALLAAVGCKKDEDQNASPIGAGAGSPSPSYTSTNPTGATRTPTRGTPGSTGSTTGSMAPSGSTGSMGSSDTGGTAATGTTGTDTTGTGTTGTAGSTGADKTGTSGSEQRASVSITARGTSKMSGTIEVMQSGSGLEVRADLRDVPKQPLELAFVDGCNAGDAKVIADIGELVVDPDGTVQSTTNVANQSLTGTTSMMGKSVAIRDMKGKELACGSISSARGTSSGGAKPGTGGGM